MDACGLMSGYSRSFTHLSDDEEFGHQCGLRLIVYARVWTQPMVMLIVKPTIQYIYDAETARWKWLAT